MYRLAPDDCVRECGWFKQETENGNLSRTQRIKYAIQGGITDSVLTKWDFSIAELKSVIHDVKQSIDMLSKYTHINPEVFAIEDGEVEKLSEVVLNAFVSLVETIENYRGDLRSFLDGHIEDHLIDSVIGNSFVNIDSLAPHYSLEGADVSDYHVSEINAFEIVVEVYGYVHVTLEYGSRSERRDDDGLDISQSFPFETNIRYVIDENFPSASYDVDDYDVDTSYWYGDADDEMAL